MTAATTAAAPGKPAAEQLAKKPKAPSKITKDSTSSKRKESNRPLCEEDIIKTFPADASSVMLVYGRKINLDSFSETTPLYSQLRAWVQDDPFRIVPRPEATIDYFRSMPKQPKPSSVKRAKEDSRTAMDNTDIEEAVALSGDENEHTASWSGATLVNTSELSMADLRKDVVQRAKKVRRIRSKKIQKKSKLGLESLRQKGIHIS